MEILVIWWTCTNFICINFKAITMTLWFSISSIFEMYPSVHLKLYGSVCLITVSSPLRSMNIGGPDRLEEKKQVKQWTWNSLTRQSLIIPGLSTRLRGVHSSHILCYLHVIMRLGLDASKVDWPEPNDAERMTMRVRMGPKKFVGRSLERTSSTGCVYLSRREWSNKIEGSKGGAAVVLRKCFPC